MNHIKITRDRSGGYKATWPAITTQYSGWGATKESAIGSLIVTLNRQYPDPGVPEIHDVTETPSLLELFRRPGPRP